MRILLDRGSSVPLYQQIEAHLRRTIESGSLPAAARLPATRELARDLGVNRNTVENAYAELEADGLIAARAGSGTYVEPALPQLPDRSPRPLWPQWQRELEVRIDPQSEPSDDDALTPGSNRGISFSEGLGDPGLFPAEEFRRALAEVMRRDGIAALEYGEPEGHAGLRRTIVGILASQGLPARPSDVLITAGSQQALALVSALLLQPGDAVVVERPTYAGALDLFRAQGLLVVGVASDAQGMRVDMLQALLRRHQPKLIYTVPNFQNPTGACLSSARRRHLAELADQHDIPILEDDYVGDLRYDGRAQPPLKAFDLGGRVIYVSTFSKMLMPGLRVGFLVAEGPVRERLARFKRLHDLATSNLIQRAVDEYVTVGRYQAHLRRSCRIYRKRRDAMLEAIARHLPGGVEVDPPRGGLFVWMRLPSGLTSAELLPLARQQGVSFAPGGRFFPDPSEGDPFVRLSFAAHAPEVIEEGIRRLGKAMRCLAS